MVFSVRPSVCLCPSIFPSFFRSCVLFRGGGLVWGLVWVGRLGCFRRTDFLLPPPAVSLYGEREKKRKKRKREKDTLIKKYKTIKKRDDKSNTRR